ncbi:hypothetical protein P7K49_003302 [Saguinus oedipus]|uniref:Uncharacterized protein n=1 Tax=Saguinus oedipus TaxID=9490 RepID=A0ABQ9WJS8_SAGOE|nr:hypothetical protein P7K49_003302 [Saguinus oedipus]
MLACTQEPAQLQTPRNTGPRAGLSATPQPWPHVEALALWALHACSMALALCCMELAALPGACHTVGSGKENNKPSPKNCGSRGHRPHEILVIIDTGTYHKLERMLEVTRGFISGWGGGSDCLVAETGWQVPKSGQEQLGLTWQPHTHMQPCLAVRQEQVTGATEQTEMATWPGWAQESTGEHVASLLSATAHQLGS